MVPIRALRETPALLKLDFFCRERDSTPPASWRRAGGGLLRARAGLGWGLEAILPDGL